MIFSSNAFIFVFLPIALAGYYSLALAGRRAAAVWLVLLSFVFYGYWNPSYLLLLTGSIAWNYGVAAAIHSTAEGKDRRRFALLWTGIIGNLGLLGWYKYLFPAITFLAEHNIFPPEFERTVVLPLGISFFTFTQIGYLVDSYDGTAKERGPLSYMLFVTFFPHLIAGPILHNREMMPQFGNRETYRFRPENIAVGLSIFVIGMTKKVLLADPLGIVADRGFADPAVLSSGGAWMTLLAYSMQLYFDFSGYSDMAIGIARLFGVVFPANFASPYRATSIIEFWSRWHMTLTRYLTLYLYNPVAMRISRRRVARGLKVSKKALRTVPAFTSLVVVPTFFTMGLAGVWHGAGFQFVIFGLLHASYLSINHAWRMFGPERSGSGPVQIAGALALTYGAVLLGQVFFRAASTSDALILLEALGGGGGASMMANGGLGTVLRIVLCMGICLLLPNSQQLMRERHPVLDPIAEPPLFRGLIWQPDARWAIILGIALLAALLKMSDTSKFLYFQF